MRAAGAFRAMLVVLAVAWLLSAGAQQGGNSIKLITVYVDPSTPGLPASSYGQVEVIIGDDTLYSIRGTALLRAGDSISLWVVPELLNRNHWIGLSFSDSDQPGRRILVCDVSVQRAEGLLSEVRHAGLLALLAGAGAGPDTLARILQLLPGRGAFSWRVPEGFPGGSLYYTVALWDRRPGPGAVELDRVSPMWRRIGRVEPSQVENYFGGLNSLRLAGCTEV